MTNRGQLFLQQSYVDAWNEYAYILNHPSAVGWDHVIITASSEEQAQAYRLQLDERLAQARLPGSARYAVVPDPQNKRVGSGGATLNILSWLSAQGVRFSSERILVIHSGGDAKRVPQYSALGKLFSPVPRLLPDGRRSTLFDELIIALCGMPARMNCGMVVASGDVLLLFNALQIDLEGHSAAAISISEDVQTGQRHGVFLAGEGAVRRFLHKKEEAILRACGAVNAQGKVDIDTGLIWMHGDVLGALADMIAQEPPERFVNERVRLSFYGDFLYPLAEEATLQDYLAEEAEGVPGGELTHCRRRLWEVLRRYRMNLIRLSPAQFIHFGTTAELLRLVTDGAQAYAHLGWNARVLTNAGAGDFSANNAYIAPGAQIGSGSYVEDSRVGARARVGRGCILSNVWMEEGDVPDGTVLSGVRLRNGRCVVRRFAVSDNPKEDIGRTSCAGQGAGDLWAAPLYGDGADWPEALAAGGGSHSLSSSFQDADARAMLQEQRRLEDEIRCARAMDGMARRTSGQEWLAELGNGDALERQTKRLLDAAPAAPFGQKMRIYACAAAIARNKGLPEGALLESCYATVRDMIEHTALEPGEARFVREEAVSSLPLRVNFGGTWSDTPPYCLERGGDVLAAPVLLRGQRPVQTVARRTDEPVIVLESLDQRVAAVFEDCRDLRPRMDPYDPHALCKAALSVAGFLPPEDGDLRAHLTRMGGGLCLAVSASAPKGSGLGTSSVLALSCLQALLAITGREASAQELATGVLRIEQLMGAGGGWQDQCGVLFPGLHIVRTRPGNLQVFQNDPVRMDPATQRAFQERHVLVFSGQRRMARNILREVVVRYLMDEEHCADVIYEKRRLADIQRFELEKGNIDAFGALLTEQFRLSKRLEAACTNTCIEQIFDSCDDLICGRYVCGAGGGGFLQMLLRQGVPKAALHERLSEVFGDCGVQAWDSSIVFDFTNGQ